MNQEILGCNTAVTYINPDRRSCIIDSVIPCGKCGGVVGHGLTITSISLSSSTQEY